MSVPAGVHFYLQHLIDDHDYCSIGLSRDRGSIRSGKLPYHQRYRFHIRSLIILPVLESFEIIFQGFFTNFSHIHMGFNLDSTILLCFTECVLNLLCIA